MEKSLTLDQARASDVLVEPSEPGEFVNASGHKQELERNFRLINICGLGVTAGNTWLALGGSLVRAQILRRMIECLCTSDYRYLQWYVFVSQFRLQLWSIHYKDLAFIVAKY